MRQEKESFDNDDINTAQILFSNDDPKKRFSSDNRVTLPESFEIKGDLTDLHVGDFNGDGKDDFLRVGKGNADISSKIFFSNGDGNFSSVNLQVADNKDIKDPRNSAFRFRSLKVADMNGDGKDDIITHSGIPSGSVSKTSIFLSEDDGNFSKPAGIGFGGHIDQTATNIQTGDFNGDGNHDLIHLSSRFESNKIALVEGFQLVGSEGDDILVGSLGNDPIITGRGGNDKLAGGEGNDVLDGGEGNDVLEGGEGSDVLNGREGTDTVSYENSRSRVIINLANSTASGGDAEGDAIFNFENVIGSDFNDILTGDDSDNQLIGNKGTDVLNGGAGNDTLNGGSGNDTLNGGDNNDILEGGAGNDLLDGGGGLDIASYQGNLDGFDITVNDDGSITVKDIDTSDGDEGTDTLTNISQLAFGGNTQLRAGSNTNTVLGIAGVHESTDNTDTSTSIAGGKAAATNFVIDIEGESGLGLDFDTTKLANFINDITLPNQEIENARLAANLGFD